MYKSDIIYEEIENNWSNLLTTSYAYHVWQKASMFAEYICRNRGESHGYGHMVRVTHICYYLWCKLDISKFDVNESQLTILLLTAQLHDVADHKYDTDGTILKQMTEFLNSIVPEHTTTILLLIDNVSYSKQVKREMLTGTTNWTKHLGNDIFVIIRNICSDADKLDALSKIGIIRCMQYAREKYIIELKKDESKQLEPEKEFVISHLKKHAEDKLLLLHKNFIMTANGLKMSKIFDQEFRDILGNSELLTYFYDKHVVTDLY